LLRKPLVVLPERIFATVLVSVATYFFPHECTHNDTERQTEREKERGRVVEM